MIDGLEVLRSEFDAFSVEQIFVTPDGWLRAIISGVECRLDAKATPVADAPLFGLHLRDNRPFLLGFFSSDQAC
jgi:hypothetical protein